MSPLSLPGEALMRENIEAADEHMPCHGGGTSYHSVGICQACAGRCHA